MKNLSPVWFLKDPIDVEEKHYILLDFLKSVDQEIKKNNFYFPLKTVSSLSKELDHFYKYKTLENFLDRRLSDDDFDLLDSYFNGYFSDEEIKEIDDIIRAIDHIRFNKIFVKAPKNSRSMVYTRNAMAFGMAYYTNKANQWDTFVLFDFLYLLPPSFLAH
jgi:heme oxygenase